MSLKIENSRHVAKRVRSVRTFVHTHDSESNLMNKTKYPSYPTISLIKIQTNKAVLDQFTVTVLVLQCFLYTHAFKMVSCVTLLLYYKVVFLDFCLEYKHNDGMTFSPDLELKNSF